MYYFAKDTLKKKKKANRANVSGDCFGDPDTDQLFIRNNANGNVNTEQVFNKLTSCSATCYC